MPRLEQNDVRLRTGEAARLVGVDRRTLLRWEARGLLSPIRLWDGTRRWSLREIQELVDQAAARPPKPSFNPKARK